MNKMYFYVAVFMIGWVSIVEAGGNWLICSTEDANLEISLHNVPVITTTYHFWAKNWNYADSKLSIDEYIDRQHKFSGQVDKLNLQIRGTISSPKHNQLQYQWQIKARKDHTNIIGGGLEFNLNLKIPALSKGKDGPILLNDNRGWKWEAAPGETITVEFDKPLAKGDL